MSLIVRVAARGDGVAEDGRHAPFAAPGDTLTEAGEVVPGSHHQLPPCRHFPECGGCRLQHLDDEVYALFVADRVASALDAQELSAPIRPALLSPPNSRRRATLHADKGLLGFAAEKSHAIIDMRECHILAPELFALVAPLRSLLRRLGLRRRADVHLTLTDQGPEVLVRGFAPEGLVAHEAVNAFSRAQGVARFAVDGGFGPEARWEPEPVTVTLGTTPVPFPPHGFLQATRGGEAALVAAARESTAGARTVADLFAGLGTLALSLPAKVYAAEGARDAALALKAAANARRLPVFVDHRDLYRRPLTAAELDRFDAVILDPPRAGAREQAMALAACRVGSITYISCNPSTFARDAKMLSKGGWRIEWVQPVGQFRWSTHVELAAKFVR